MFVSLGVQNHKYRKVSKLKLFICNDSISKFPWFKMFSCFIFELQKCISILNTWNNEIQNKNAFN